MRHLRKPLFAVVAFLLVIQLGRPDRTNPPEEAAATIQASLAVPPEVNSILNRSCADCHSHRTVWPWYSNIAPASWLIARDVNEGRAHMNLSEWASYDRQKQENLLGEMCEEVTGEGMPIPQYTMVHREARLTAQEVELLCGWTKSAF